MKLDAATAVIPAEKLRDYLLSPSHPIGRYKSSFFRSLGYGQEQWPVLERDLRAMLLNNDASPAGVTEYGQKFLISGLLTGPNSDSAGIISVWIILTAETVARFVTAYPEE
jgi:hypothetical protein